MSFDKWRGPGWEFGCIGLISYINLNFSLFCLFNLFFGLFNSLFSTFTIKFFGRNIRISNISLVLFESTNKIRAKISINNWMIFNEIFRSNIVIEFISNKVLGGSLFSYFSGILTSSLSISLYFGLISSLLISGLQISSFRISFSFGIGITFFKSMNNISIFIYNFRFIRCNSIGFILFKSRLNIGINKIYFSFHLRWNIRIKFSLNIR